MANPIAAAAQRGIDGFGFGFGFGFIIQHCCPVVDTLLPAKTWTPVRVLSAFIEAVRFRSISREL